MSDTDIQRGYYASTAHSYDTLHAREMRDLAFSVNAMLGMADFLGVRSVLDIGSGTGRLLTIMQAARPGLSIKGVEPVRELRDLACSKGLDVVDADALRMPFGDGEFDLVCEFAVLHHIKTPGVVVGEMLRVARKAIFICDSNNFGHGSAIGRIAKQTLNTLGLWSLADLAKTRGKGYTISAGDGLAYSYSVYNDLAQIELQCERVHIINIAPSGVNPYRTSSSVALLGIKA
jgi:SAM-dependent methyltransferase